MRQPLAELLGARGHSGHLGDAAQQLFPPLASEEVGGLERGEGGEGLCRRGQNAALLVEPVPYVRQGGGPVPGLAELAVHAARAAMGVEAAEREAQNLGGHGPFQDLRTLEGEIGRGRGVVGDGRRAREIVLVVAASPADREGGRHGRGAAARASDPLLVVEAARRHVGHQDCGERPDVYMRLPSWW